MKYIQFILGITVILLGLLGGGCISSKDLTQNPSERTDYQMGVKYRLIVPLFLYKIEPEDRNETPRLARMGQSGTPKDPVLFRQKMSRDPQVLGLLEVGDEVQIKQLREHGSPTTGRFLILHGMITSGAQKGVVVDLGLVSTHDRTNGKILINPSYLQPIN